MYVEAICPLCLATHVLPIEMRGEKYRCEECEEVFIVNRRSKQTSKRPPRPRKARAADDREGAAPANKPDVLPVATASPSPRRDRDDDRPRRRAARRRRNRRTGLYVALSGILFTLFVVAGGGAWWYYHNRGAGQDTDPEGHHDIDVRVAAGQPIDDGDPWKKDPGKAKKDPAKKDPDKPEGPPPWRAKADPPAWRAKADPLSLPADFRKEYSGNSLNTEVVFPTSTASPFVAVGDNSDAKDEREVWNLQTGQMTGKLVGSKYSSVPPVLSPDGARLAILPFGEKEIVDVWPLAGGKAVRIDTGMPTDVVDFAGPGKLLVAGKRGTTLHVRVWDAKTGKREGDFDGPPLGNPPTLTRDMLAVSPGGAYLAVVTPEALWLWDLKTGTASGRRPLEWNAANWLLPCRGLSFSPDGKELAGLFQVNEKSRLVWWDVADHGNEVRNVTFPLLRLGVGAETAYKGQVLGWVGDHRGWLLFGQMFIDRRAKTVGLPPPGLLAPDQPFRRLVGPDHIATLPGGLGGKKTLTIALFDPEKP